MPGHGLSMGATRFQRLGRLRSSGDLRWPTDETRSAVTTATRFP